VRTLADGRAVTMTPATVNNHLAHLSAFFTWTAGPGATRKPGVPGGD